MYVYVYIYGGVRSHGGIQNHPVVTTWVLPALRRLGTPKPGSVAVAQRVDRPRMGDPASHGADYKKRTPNKPGKFRTRKSGND